MIPDQSDELDETPAATHTMHDAMTPGVKG